VGSVFSPYYAWAQRSGPADPENHCALNVALYSRPARRGRKTDGGGSHGSRDRAKPKCHQHPKREQCFAHWAMKFSGYWRVCPKQTLNWVLWQ